MDRTAGRVLGINITPSAGAMPQPVERVRAVAGKGLEGDRYGAGTGTYSDHPGGGRHVTLIAREDLDAISRESGIALGAAESRRNVLTEGVDLPSLVGRRFWVGTALCVGVRLCEPCEHLEGKTRAGVIKAYVHRAGLRAEVLQTGEIAVGSQVREAAPEPENAPETRKAASRG